MFANGLTRSVKLIERVEAGSSFVGKRAVEYEWDLDISECSCKAKQIYLYLVKFWRGHKDNRGHCRAFDTIQWLR